MQELKVIVELTNALKVIPGIGNKSAERIAYEFLKMNPEKIDNLVSALKNIQSNLSICPKCFCYKENDKCLICDDDSRSDNTLIVVTSFKDVLALERLNIIHAKYHVLNGSISPTKGISANDLNINKLISRITENNIKEVILATSPTIDGETTALYISHLLNKIDDIKVTRLAYGLPMGANLDFADELTLTKAFEGRTNYKK